MSRPERMLREHLARDLIDAVRILIPLAEDGMADEHGFLSAGEIRRLDHYRDLARKAEESISEAA